MSAFSGSGKYRLTNSTPHSLDFSYPSFTGEKEVSVSIPKPESEKAARVKEMRSLIGQFQIDNDGKRISVSATRIVLSGVKDLPPQEKGRLVVVSMLVAQVVGSKRDDLVCPYSEKANRGPGGSFSVPGLIKFDFSSLEKTREEKTGSTGPLDESKIYKISNYGFSPVSLGSVDPEGKFVPSLVLPTQPNPVKITFDVTGPEWIEVEGLEEPLPFYLGKAKKVDKVPSSADQEIALVSVPVGQAFPDSHVYTPDFGIAHRSETGIGFTGIATYSIKDVSKEDSPS